MSNITIPIMYYPIEKRISARTVYLIVFYISAVLMTAITFYALYQSVVEYAATGKIVIGEILVKTEFPFQGLSKLVTYLMIVSVISWYCVTKLGGEKVKEVPPALRSILQLIVLAIAIVSLYEFVYNFVVWSSLITINALGGSINLDSISIPYPNPDTPWNLVFATKMSLAAFLISTHGFYIISKKGKE
ncbi:MAG: hypothetical protein M3P28_02590 [Thermoproteota archaeon]|nr:hypothetical protein [Thermoproteota archaeon]